MAKFTGRCRLAGFGRATSPLLILTVVTLILFAFGGSVLFSSRLA